MKCTCKFVKYTTFLILAAVLFAACHSSENKETKSQTEQATETDTQHEHESATGLSLNNGVKWKADSSTNKNVLDLYNLIADANPVILDDYQKTGKILQTNINKMISECRMQGADHDALHQWLEPLMEMNRKMTDVASADEGKGLFGMIRKHIEKYSDYFE